MGVEVYAPVLKWKAGEKKALHDLNDVQKSKIIPIIEITEEIYPSKLLEDFKQTSKHSFYFDTIYVDQGDRSYMYKVASYLSENWKALSPVLYYNDFPELAKKIKNLCERIAIRVPVPEDIDGPTYEDIFSYLEEWSNRNNIYIDIMLDLDEIENRREANKLFKEIEEIMILLDSKNVLCNNIFVMLTSFPSNLGSLASGESAFFERFDIRIFKKIVNSLELNQKKLNVIYSDYGVTKFTETEIDFSKQKYPILPKARYTTEEKYWVLKGERDHFKKEWIKSYKELAQEILNSRYYYGENFSFGDLEIKQRAQGEKTQGYHREWVTIAANHHIAVVIEQLSKLYGA